MPALTNKPIGKYIDILREKGLEAARKALEEDEQWSRKSLERRQNTRQTDPDLMGRGAREQRDYLREKLGRPPESE